MSTATIPATAYRRSDPAWKEVVNALEVAKETGADPRVVESLIKALEFNKLRDEYALHCTSLETATCKQVTDTTVSTQWLELQKQGKTKHNLSPLMLSGRLEGQFLKSLVSTQRARCVLDVGMYTGYSALTMAEALPADGQLVTLDAEPFMKEFNQPVFDAAPQGKKITIKIGPALDSMKELLKDGRKFDFIFLDAQKSEYTDYLKICFDEGLLAENGTIAVDNAFRHGDNYLPSDKPPDAARLFGDFVANEKRLHKVLVPIRDGVILIRRLTEVERDLPH